MRVFVQIAEIEGEMFYVEQRKLTAEDRRSTGNAAGVERDCSTWNSAAWMLTSLVLRRKSAAFVPLDWTKPEDIGNKQEKARDNSTD
jgi:hypothetical protein